MIAKEYRNMLDSGKRQEFDTGCVRDSDEGKLEWSLFPPCVWELVLLDPVAPSEDQSVVTLVTQWLRGCAPMTQVLDNAIKNWGVEPLAIWIAKGADKYEPFNWTRGMPVSRCVDSLGRHLHAVVLERDDEDHRAVAMCNMAFIAHYQEAMPWLDDMKDVYHRKEKPEVFSSS